MTFTKVSESLLDENALLGVICVRGFGSSSFGLGLSFILKNERELQ